MRAGVIVLAMLLAGCGGSIHIPADLRTPTVAGVVQETTRLANGHWQFQLANGQTIEIDFDHTTSLLGGPQVGRLLLAGVDPDGREWVAGVIAAAGRGRPPGCFSLGGHGRAADGWIELEGGFRLPKAADFTDPSDHQVDVFSSDRGTFCLNDKGEVTSYDIG